MCGSPWEKQMSVSGSTLVGADEVGLAVGKAVVGALVVGTDVASQPGQHWAPWLPVDVHEV
jgi:hypothetical protein